MSEPVHVTITPKKFGVDAEPGFVAQVNGTAMPVLSYAVEPVEEGGQVLVSLVVVADSVTVSPTGKTAPARTSMSTTQAISAWGAAQVTA